MRFALERVSQADKKVAEVVVGDDDGGSFGGELGNGSSGLGLETVLVLRS